MRTLSTARAGGGAVVTTIVTLDGRSATGLPHVRGWIVDVTGELGRAARGLDGIAVVIRGPVAAVVAAGEFDISRREAFRAALVAAATADRDVYLDTRHVGFFEARAVAMLDDLAAVLAPDHELVVVDPPPAVRLVTGGASHGARCRRPARRARGRDGLTVSAIRRTAGPVPTHPRPVRRSGGAGSRVGGAAR